jgi:outer membrane protein assembly factor BamB
MNRAVRAAALATLLLPLAGSAQPLPPAAPDPANLRGESTQTRKRLAEAEQKLLAGKAADAADDLQRVLDESADDLITIDGKHYQPARRVAHQLLARLPAEALKAYRDRIDQPAKKLLDQAKRDRDPRPLRQLLDRYFVSEPADEAILLLGDLLFERGEFRAAEGVWRQLLPDGGADVTYPGSKADPALVRARLVLAAIFQHDPRAKAELAAFKEKHPDAKGTLAGKTGPLADALRAFLDAPPELPPDATAGADWPTYGGAPDRSGRVPGGIPRYWPSQPSWSTGIPPDPNLIRHGPLNPPGRPPFAHPVVIGGEAFVADGTRIFGFDLRTGKRTRSYSPLKLNVPPAARIGDACFTLSASGGRLYARLGPSVVRAPETQAGGKASEESILVCLSPRLKELWRLSPPEEKVPVAWEGAPLASGRRLWAVYAKFEGGRTVHVAACYDPADGETSPGRPAWTAELCDSPLPVAGEGRTRQELLTLAGRHLVFCSNGGAVVAVDAATGRPAWGFRYPRSRKAAGAAAGDPAPAVAFGGRVFVAPADGERVYALDAETGRPVWESGPTEGARIVGVARDRLIVTVAGPVRGIRGLNLDTGAHRPADGGWVQHQGDGLLSYGQGLVTDDVIVWPSRKGLHFLDPRDGYPLARPYFAPFPNVLQNYFGNLAYADGVLVVVTPLQVWGYAAESRKVVPRPDAPPRERFETMIDDAERKLASGDAPAARAALAATATSDLPPAFCAWAAARLVQLTPVGAANQLPAEVRAVLQPGILNEWLLPPDGVPVTLEAFLRRRLGKPSLAGSVPVTAARPDCEMCAPGLNAESDFDRTLRLPAGVSPLRAIPGVTCAPRRLFAAGPRQVIAVPLDQGAESEHAAADLFTHAADLRDGFVAAGPFAVAIYGAGREPAWVFRVPLTDRLPEGAYEFRLRCDREPAVPHLSSFVLAGPWLLARIGEHHLIALDLHARRVAWVLCATGRAGFDPKLFPTAPRFGPHFAVIGSTLVAQLSDGRRWFVRLDTGRPAAVPALGERTARAEWAQPPVRVGPNLLAVSDGPGLVRLLQFGGRVRWAFEAEFEEGLTGEPPQMRAWGDVLIIAVRRNHGVEFERVGLGDGKPAWSRGPAFADADRIDLSAADADAERVYVPAGRKLLAVALGNGKTAWEADLPDTRGAGGWVVRAGKTCVIAYPTSAIPREPTADVLERLKRSFRREPLLWRLPGLAGTLYDAWVDRAVPVLVFDPETGKRLGRFDIPARGPAVSAHLDADTAVIATGDRVVWLK